MTDDADLIPAAVAAVASGSFSPSLKADAAVRIFRGMLRDIALDCVTSGSAMIGHIKANVRSGDEMMSMSSTTDDGNVRCRSVFAKDVSEYSMTVNVIVYGIENRKAAEILVPNVRKISDDVKITVHSEIGCEDPECKDPLCQDEAHKRIIMNI
ncbi:MAG: hypothetical protein FWH44_03115 [Methanomassiliicoccaceae archaeon]|nr:hypothetical protein [Methanomassiliicoccaceae archaeon]